jgi:hypothetical protein
MKVYVADILHFYRSVSISNCRLSCYINFLCYANVCSTTNISCVDPAKDRAGNGAIEWISIAAEWKGECGVCQDSNMGQGILWRSGGCSCRKGIDPRFVYARVLFDLSCSQLRCSGLVSFLISKHVQFPFDGVSPVNPWPLSLMMKCFYRMLFSTAALHTQYFKSQRYAVVYCLLPLLPYTVTKKRVPIQHETASPSPQVFSLGQYVTNTLFSWPRLYMQPLISWKETSFACELH